MHKFQLFPSIHNSAVLPLCEQDRLAAVSGERSQRRRMLLNIPHRDSQQDSCEIFEGGTTPRLEDGTKMSRQDAKAQRIMTDKTSPRTVGFKPDSAQRRIGLNRCGAKCNQGFFKRPSYRSWTTQKPLRLGGFA